jgi:DNA topoisomerase-1
MTTNLFIIEAPGKRRRLSNVLHRVGVCNLEIVATIGHLCANPEGLQPLGIDAGYRETHYRIRGDREVVAADIAWRACQAERIYLATDDDQEGEVIARDVLHFAIPDDHRHKVLRLRLKALAQSEVAAALRTALPLDEAHAAQGDARRMMDRLIGSLSSEVGAVGRVQGSLLLALAQQQPVVGVVTHTLAAADGGKDFIAQVPVLAGQAVPDPLALHRPLAVQSASDTTIGGPPLNHDQILLEISLQTGAGIRDVSHSMQSLYEQGRLSYPRAKDTAITAESLKRLSLIARANGAGFRPELFGTIRGTCSVHAHEAPNPLVLDVPVNRPDSLLSLSEVVLSLITRRLIQHGMDARLERPLQSALPEKAKGLPWHRLSSTATHLWPPENLKAGYRAWSPEQSLLHFMMEHHLGRPSTVVDHIDKFLSRQLVTREFDLTAKGRAWCENVVSLLGRHNLSREVEDYIETHRGSPSEMVRDMLESFRLTTIALRIEQQSQDEATREGHEVSAGIVP